MHVLFARKQLCGKMYSFYPKQIEIETENLIYLFLGKIEQPYLCVTVLCVCVSLCVHPPQCSSTCAGGFQRRVVVCQDENGYSANNCEERTRPIEQQSCESGPCPQWVYGNWGEVRHNATYLFFIHSVSRLWENVL